MPSCVRQRAERLEPRRVVVVARDRDHRRDRRADRAGRSITTASASADGRRRLVEVAGDERPGRLLRLAAISAISAQHRGVLGEAGLAADRLAHVPVGRVQDPHVCPLTGGPRRGRPSAAARGALLGPGRPRGERELDHERHRQLGLGHEHRARLRDPRPLPVRCGQEPVLGPRRPRPGRAGPRRESPSWRSRAAPPRSRSARAPTRIIPRLRPRSATSRRISLIGLVPSRGAYLLSSSRTRNSSGVRVPVSSLASNARFTVTPTTNRCARSVRLWMSTTVTCAPSTVSIRRSSRRATSARISAPSDRCDDSSRRTNALIVPEPDRAPGPVDRRCRSSLSRSTISSTRSW